MNKIFIIDIVCFENWRYSIEDEIGIYKSWGIYFFYNGGGYVVNFGYDDFMVCCILKDLVNNGWIDC